MITILCAGSRGDFQPYLALAMELKKLGKDVRITGMREFESFIRSYGIDFYPIQADFKSLNVDENMLKQAQSADNPLKMLLTFNKMKKYGALIANEYYASCEGSELIIYHPGVTLGYFAAEKLGIPSILASPFPMHKTKEQTSVIQYGRKKSKPFTNQISYFMLQGMLWLASKDSVTGFWKKKFGGRPKGFGRPYERHNNKQNPAVISCSNFVFNRPSDWNENIHQSGYWFVEEKMDYTPSKELSDFLSSGEKPVYIGFGSVFHADKKDTLSKLIIDALTRSGKRGIICGMGKIDNLPKNVIAIDSIPHSWLFERVSAVCHHGGAGTTAAGFKAGIPSIIVPFANDQFAWAHRAHDLGVGSKPIPAKTLTADNLAAAIDYALQDNIKIKAKTLAENIATESGALDCAKVIVASLAR
ncbi:glycosyltransferase [Clostridium lacusfryxellense]|uniref:glycosyltransferase n=1 Tax=Clostridium lacusfryxellense TaxID=205328 RepID=UPI001C0AAC32|nr:glycosyltransferase [Clostridium lacusfryxellense]MBU3113669.1 glycosyltransferase [Clostridium lacusfryxellense]